MTLLLDQTADGSTVRSRDAESVGTFSKVGDVNLVGVLELGHHVSNDVVYLDSRHVIGSNSRVTASRVRVDGDVLESAGDFDSDRLYADVQIDGAIAAIDGGARNHVVAFSVDGVAMIVEGQLSLEDIDGVIDLNAVVDGQVESNNAVATVNGTESNSGCIGRFSVIDVVNPDESIALSYFLNGADRVVQ